MLGNITHTLFFLLDIKLYVIQKKKKLNDKTLSCVYCRINENTRNTENMCIR